MICWYRFLDSTRSDSIGYPAFSLWLPSLSVIISQCIHVSFLSCDERRAFSRSSLWLRRIPWYVYYMHVPRLLYPSVCWWTFRFFRVLSSVKIVLQWPRGGCVNSYYGFSSSGGWGVSIPGPAVAQLDVFNEPPHCPLSWLSPISVPQIRAGWFSLPHAISHFYCL